MLPVCHHVPLIVIWTSKPNWFKVACAMEKNPKIMHHQPLLYWCWLVLLTVFRYAVFRFVLVEKTKSAKNIWEPVFENVIILGFLVADTSSKRQKIYIFC